MNIFSIRDIEMLSGIKAHTFRIWEQRHGLYFSKRKGSKHRSYDNEDLKAVLRIAFLYHSGHKISKLAVLTKEEVLKLTANTIDELNYDSYFHQLIEASIDYDDVQFEKIIHNLIMHFGFEKSMFQVLNPFLEKIGMLWVTDHIIPAQEHFISSLIQQKVLTAIDKLGLNTSKKEKTVLIFSPEGEYHEIPLLVACYFFKKHGINTVYFGINIPLAEIEYYCSNKSVTHFYIHVITNFIIRNSDEYLNDVSLKFPGVKIIASGAGLKNNNISSAAIKIVTSIDDLIPAIG